MREVSWKEAFRKTLGINIVLLLTSFLIIGILVSAAVLPYVEANFGAHLCGGIMAGAFLAAPFAGTTIVREKYGKCINCGSWMKKTQYRCSDCDSEYRNTDARK